MLRSVTTLESCCEGDGVKPDLCSVLRALVANAISNHSVSKSTTEPLGPEVARGTNDSGNGIGCGPADDVPVPVGGIESDSLDRLPETDTMLVKLAAECDECAVIPEVRATTKKKQ